MAALLVSVAKAITSELGSIDLSESVEIVRSYADWQAKLEDFETGLRLDVVPVDCPFEQQSRGKYRYECVVNLLLRRTLDPRTDRHLSDGRIDPEVIDGYVEDLQTVSEFFAPNQPSYDGRKLTDVSDAAWIAETTLLPTARRSGVAAPYSQEMLLKDQYSGLVTVVYRVVRSR